MKRTIGGLAISLVVASGSLAIAQITTTQVTTTGQPTPNAEIRRVSQLLGVTVQLQGMNNFGRVEDAVIDDNGMIAYLVVSSNGRNIMLPWSEAQFDFGRRIAVYSIAPQAVQPLFFNAGAWPNVWAPAYVTRVRQVFPRANIIRREVLRPAAPGIVPPPAGTVPPSAGTAPAPPGAAVPPGGAVDEKGKGTPKGDVKVKERSR
jgi:hypothetical protein